MAKYGETIRVVLDVLAQNLAGPADSFLAAARNPGMEEVFIVYTAGRGKFSDKGPPWYINLEVDLFDFRGQWIGYESGVHFSKSPPEAAVVVPEAPPLPIGNPPVPASPAEEWTKALFTFNDGSLIVEGPAQTHLTPLENGDAIFSVTTSHSITTGTGAYEGARGTKQATGTGLIKAADRKKFPSAGLIFPVTTIETFRLVRKQYQEAAASGEEREEPEEKGPARRSGPRGGKQGKETTDER